MTKRSKQNPGYTHQGFVNDRLFNASCDHALGPDRKSKVAAIFEALCLSRQTLRELTLKIADKSIVDSEVVEIYSLGGFSVLENLAAHESDLYSDVIFPPSLVSLELLSFEIEPTFPFFGPDYTSLPNSLQTILSYSKKPDILQQKPEHYPPPRHIKVETRFCDDSLPKGVI